VKVNLLVRGVEWCGCVLWMHYFSSKVMLLDEFELQLQEM